VNAQGTIENFDSTTYAHPYRYSNRNYFHVVTRCELTSNQAGADTYFLAQLEEVKISFAELACIIAETSNRGDNYVRMYDVCLHQVEDEMKNAPKQMARNCGHKPVRESVDLFFRG